MNDDDDIEIVHPQHPPEAAGDLPETDDPDPDPDRLPESRGMREDAVDPDVPFFSWDGLGSHLEELRRRIVIGLAVFVPLFGLGLYLYRYLWRILILPLERAEPNLSRFQALSPSDGLVMAMRIAFAFALFLSLPVWLGQLWNFVSPGLRRHERRVVYLALGSGGVLFAIGAAAAYFAGIPFALEYLLPFNQSLSGWENAFTGAGYVDFVVTCCAGFGFAFELPLVMAILAWAGVLTREGVRNWWRACVLAVFVLAAVMTPPDPFTQLLLALPMIGLFGIGYMLVGWMEKRR